MSSKDNIMEKILALQSLLLAQKQRNGNTFGLERLSTFMTGIKRVGVIDDVKLNGKLSRYIIIDGHSWLTVCHSLKIEAPPSYVMLEEAELLSFLKQHVVLSARKQANSPAIPKERRIDTDLPPKRRRMM